MIEYVRGDLLKSSAQVLVNTINTVGIMGAGIALQFKEQYPEMFQKYQTLCKKKLLDVCKLYLWKSTDTSSKEILLFPTKKHWLNLSELHWIEAGLQKFVENYERLNIKSIAFPKLGCGNGGLSWHDVKPVMEKYLEPLPIKIYVYI